MRTSRRKRGGVYLGEQSGQLPLGMNNQYVRKTFRDVEGARYGTAKLPFPTETLLPACLPGTNVPYSGLFLIQDPFDFSSPAGGQNLFRRQQT